MNHTTTPLTIERLNHEGRGVAHLEGKTAFIEGALAGERVSVTWTRKHKRFDEGIATQVEGTPSPLRVSPPCPHFGVCGGCSLQHLSPHAQLAHKEQVLLEQLSHFGKITPKNVLTPLRGPSLNYRRKARLSAKYVAKKNAVLVGFREKNGRFVADIGECPILRSPLNTLVGPLKTLVFTLNAKGHIPQIEIACADNATALVFRHLIPLTPEDIKRMQTFGREHTLVIYAQASSRSSIQRIYPETAIPLQYTLPAYPLTFQFHPLDFIQVNGEINPSLVKKTVELLNPTKEETVLDLFCGLGNFTLPLATRCKTVYGVEGDAALIKSARENAARNHSQNATFFLADLTRGIKNEPWFHLVDAVLLDPPRTGALEVIQELKDIPTKRVVYVSCNSTTLARDAGVLVHQQGYTLEAIGTVDMFPHTAHAESVALFTRES